MQHCTITIHIMSHCFHRNTIMVIFSAKNVELSDIHYDLSVEHKYLK